MQNDPTAQKPKKPSYKTRCARNPSPLCDEMIQRACENINRGASPAKVCALRGDGSSQDKLSDRNAVGE